MATKDYDLSLGDKSKSFNNAFSNHDNQQYSNLNLNGIHQSSKIDPIFQSSGSNSFKNDKRNFNDFNNTKAKNDFNSLNKSEKSSQNLLSPFSDAVKEEKENRWKKKDAKKNKSNDSTLSLHISAYENSVEAASAAAASNGEKKDGYKGLSKSMKNSKFSLTSSAAPSPFEMPRQPSDKEDDPEIMKFKASQKLLNPNDEEWKKKAKEILKKYYDEFGKSEFDGYNPQTDIPLLTTKICLAMFGAPENDAYSDEQKCKAQKIIDAMIKVQQEAGITQLSVGVAVIYCKKEEEEFTLPIFRFHTGDSSSSKYVDINCQIYDSWNDWKENNQLPEMKYCYPKNGYFSCSNDEYKFDASLDPILEYGNSPACSLSDFEKWKKRTKETLKIYYLALGRSEFEGYNPQTDIHLLNTKICCTMFGIANKDADKIEDAHDDDQKKEAQKIVDTILKVQNDAGITELSVGIIFIHCYQEGKELHLPIFRVRTGENNSFKYVDTQCRIYDDWSDWKQNNRLPKMEYCYPTNGYYSCSNDEYKFDASLDPILEYGNSPACDSLCPVLDTIASIVGLGVGILGIIGLFTPIGWVASLGCVAAGCVLSAYSCGRAAYRLYDKGKHGESLTDVESATLWASILATPLHFISTLSNATLAVGAAQGEIFSNSTRILATALNFTTLAVDGVMLGFGLTNLIDKKSKNELSSLDVLQFSMSLFFFTHTLMQPITAKAIIQKAQNEHIQKYIGEMKDPKVKAAFEKFLKRNGGSMEADSKIIKTINLVNNEKVFFEILHEESSAGTGNKNIGVNLQRIQDCLEGKTVDEYLDGKTMFGKWDDFSKSTFIKKLRDTIGYKKELLDTAEIVAKDLNVDDPHKFMSVMEIVAADVKGKKGIDLSARLGDLQGAGKDSFVQGIMNDVNRASEIAKNSNKNFADPFKAVYHFRKHGADFPSKIPGNSCDFYLGAVPQNLLQDANLTNTSIFNDGVVKKTYITPDDKFATVIEKKFDDTILTMFQKEGSWESHISQMKQPRQQILSSNVAAATLAGSLGYERMYIYLTSNGQRKPLSEVKNLDPKIHKQIADILTSLSSSDDEKSSASGDKKSTSEDET